MTRSVTVVEFVREAVALVRSLEAGTSHRFDAFLACAKRSPAELMPEALAMACTFSYEDERRRALCALAPELEPRELLGLVTALSELGRPATLAVVAASVPSLLRAGGAELLLRVADAIREVATRWP